MLSFDHLGLESLEGKSCDTLRDHEKSMVLKVRLSHSHGGRGSRVMYVFVSKRRHNKACHPRI